ncbi:DUF6681 family protein [Vagococcus vulneris]|uniref:Uncharacterized protein n=1 Tax=Vagococcus vulneris TaxID=1977869 RepID=A0A429ZWI2_9ENTE|nr:DUF6681 family protein [Vagococcus vulneris]RST98144.1 hypothetical protein CBF37_08920 [Vagococcus vulneris]
MEALITLIFTNISKFLNYLNINPRLQNKIFTVAGLVPTLYILRIVNGYFRNENYWQAVVYLIIFIILIYFTIINFIYYFHDRKVKWDVTNFIEDIVPEDATFNGTAATTPMGKPVIHGKKLPLNLVEDADLIINDVVNKLIDSKEIKSHELNENTYLIDKYTLIPYYKIRHSELWIGSTYHDLIKIAKIKLIDDADELIPLGVFVLGGPYRVDGVTYKEPYRVQLRVRDNQESDEPPSNPVPTTPNTSKKKAKKNRMKIRKEKEIQKEKKSEKQKPTIDSSVKIKKDD